MYKYLSHSPYHTSNTLQMQRQQDIEAINAQKPILIIHINTPPGCSEWIISVGDYVDNSFTALGSSDPREVRLEL